MYRYVHVENERYYRGNLYRGNVVARLMTYEKAWNGNEPLSNHVTATVKMFFRDLKPSSSFIKHEILDENAIKILWKITQRI